MRGLEEIRNALVNHLAVVLSVDASTIEASTPLDSLGVASMALVELFVFIEKEFGLELMSAGLVREDLESVDSLAAAVERGLKHEG